MDDVRSSNASTETKRVGYWMTEKKLRRLNFEAFENLCRLICHYRIFYINENSHYSLTVARSSCFILW